MKTRKKEKQIIEKILNKVMESGILLNGNGHFAVYESKGRIISISISNGLFSSNSEVGRVELYVTPHTYWDAEDMEDWVKFFMEEFEPTIGAKIKYFVHNWMEEDFERLRKEIFEKEVKEIA